MKITTLWRRERANEMPWMVESYDEYTAEEHNGEPDWYRSERQEGDREIVIEVADEHILGLFKTPTVSGYVKS